MSERYSRLYELPLNLYAVGSPVVIAAGTLLKDNQTGRIVAQLKFRSIQQIKSDFDRLNDFVADTTELQLRNNSSGLIILQKCTRRNHHRRANSV